MIPPTALGAGQGERFVGPVAGLVPPAVVIPGRQRGRLPARQRLRQGGELAGVERGERRPAQFVDARPLIVRAQQRHPRQREPLGSLLALRVVVELLDAACLRQRAERVTQCPPMLLRDDDKLIAATPTKDDLPAFDLGEDSAGLLEKLGKGMRRHLVPDYAPHRYQHYL